MSAYPNLMTSVGCFQRIQKFLLIRELEDQRILATSSKSSFEAMENDQSSGIQMQPVGIARAGVSPILLSVEGASFYIDKREAPILREISFGCTTSSLNIIVGPVGSGKSVLLRSLLGETSIAGGHIRLGTGSIAYCDQTAWLPNLSIRRIITGTQSGLVGDWYKTVLRICVLEEDLEQLADGDESLVGSGGVSLSGGQKQRLVSALICILNIAWDFY